MAKPCAGGEDHLPRLDRTYYRGQAYVHWEMTIQDRRVGWLTALFYHTFRELLAHTAFRYAINCPIFCLMPDHIHLLWIGIHDRTDQLNAMKHFRQNLAMPLNALGFDLQYQAYDHVMRDHDRLEEEMIETAEYIARNPEREGLVPCDGYRQYPYTNCLVPGYPNLSPWQSDFWVRFWRIHSFVRKNGLFRPYDEKYRERP